MSLSTSTIATLLIAGTAIGGSAAAVVITNSPVQANQQNQLQVVQPNASVPGQSQKLTVDGKVTTIEPGAVKSSVVSPTPTTSPAPITPVDPLPPVPGFGGGKNGDDDGDHNGRGDDGDGDNHSNYSNGGNHYNGDDGDDDNEGSDD